MYIIKRDGRKEKMYYDKITARNMKLAADLSVDTGSLSQTVIGGLVSGMTSRDIDQLSCESAIYRGIYERDYGILASRIAWNDLHKSTPKTFREAITVLYNNYDKLKNKHNPLISKECFDFAIENIDVIEKTIDYQKDYNYTYFAFKLLQKSYLQKVDGKTVERGQTMLMREALGIHGPSRRNSKRTGRVYKGDINKVLDTYNRTSNKDFTHASPTKFSAGTKRPQMSSCFIKGTKVFTVNDGIKNIEDIKLNDQVVTHTGEIKPVSQVHKNSLKGRKLFSLNVAKTPEISVTGNHRFWAITNYNRKKKINPPEWVSIDKLKTEDYIMIPNKNTGVKNITLDLLDYIDTDIKYTIRDNMISKTTTWIQNNKAFTDCNGNEVKPRTFKNNHQTSFVNRFWKVDSDFCEFLGMWMGDGCIFTKRGKISGINIVSTKENTKLIDFVTNVGTKIFGVKPTIYEAKKQNLTTITFGSVIVAETLNKLCGKGFAGKHLPYFIHRMDKCCILSFLNGLISTDGCVTKDLSIKVQLTNPKLMEEIYHLSRSIGIDSSILYKINGEKISGLICFPRQTLDVKGIKKYYTDDRMNRLNNETSIRRGNPGVLFYENSTFLKIMSLNEIKNHSHTEVYTFGVEDNHSYSVEGLIAENCYILSCPDSMGDETYDDCDEIKDIIEEESIPECWKQCAKISKLGGGIGVDLTCVRPRGSSIGSTGKSAGIIPLIKVFNSIGRYVDQSGKRKGAIAVYLQPWHVDIMEFLEVRLKTTPEESRSPDIFPALWIPRLFFKRLEEDGNWSLFDSSLYPELIDLYGEQFEKRYIELENNSKFTHTMKVKTLWEKIIKSLDETGLPYMHNKDEVNEKSNQKEGSNGENGSYDDLVSIRGSNLCCEIMQNHSAKSIANCNLISVSLSRFTSKSFNGLVDWKGLGETVEVANENLNMIIDKNYYPINYCADNNFDYRPQGIGPQDLAGAFATLGISWESLGENGKYSVNIHAKVLNQLFSECMYYHALKRSNELAKIYGPYKKFKGSPASKGILQFDMWKYNDPLDSSDPLNGKTIIPYSHPLNDTIYSKISNFAPKDWNNNKVFPFNIPTYDWDSLKQSIVEHGLMNSLLIAPMPTATTSQILGNNEAFEPYMSNIYARKGVAGDFPHVNDHLAASLESIGKWNRETVNDIIKNEGSVQSLNIPQELKDIFRTSWEMSQKIIIDFSADRGAFCDQSQSLNINLARPTPSKLSSMYMYGFKKGLKTLSYYLRSLSIVDAVKFSIMDESDPIKVIKEGMEKEKLIQKAIDDGLEEEEDASGSCALGGGMCSA